MFALSLGKKEEEVCHWRPIYVPVVGDWTIYSRSDHRVEHVLLILILRALVRLFFLVLGGGLFLIDYSVIERIRCHTHLLQTVGYLHQTRKMRCQWFSVVFLAVITIPQFVTSTWW